MFMSFLKFIVDCLLLEGSDFCMSNKFISSYDLFVTLGVCSYTVLTISVLFPMYEVELNI